MLNSNFNFLNWFQILQSNYGKASSKPCGDRGTWVLLKSGAFAEHPEIREFWCKLFRLNGRHCLEKPCQTTEELDRLQAVADELHCEREYRFPTRAMNMSCHYDTHDPLAYKLAGNRQGRNMFSHERIGSNINKGAHHATQLEASMMERWKVKELDFSVFPKIS